MILSTDALLSLQRTAGNRAVSAVIARQAPPAPAAAGAPAQVSPDAALIELVETLWEEDPASAIRLGLEVIRPVPAIGLLPGLGADVIAMGQDLMAVPTGSPALTGIAGFTICLRSLTNISGNGAAQLLAVIQLAEAFLAGLSAAQTLTGFGAAADAVTLPAIATLVGLNETVTGIKLTMTTMTMFFDFVVSLEAAAGVVLGPVEDSAAWVDLMGGYVANQIGDVVAMLNECLGGLTLGFSQSGLLGLALKTIEGVVKIVLKFFNLFRDWITGFWNVLGGRAIEGIELPDLFPEPVGLEPEPGAVPAPPFGELSSGPAGGAATTPLARSAAAPTGTPPTAGPDPEWLGARLVELDAMRSCVQQGDGILEPLAGQVAELMDAAARMAEDAAFGQDGVAAIRDGMTAILGDIETRLGLLGDVESQAGSALDQLTEGSAGIAALIESLEALEVPEIELPTGFDLGGGAVGDAIEGVVGAGADAALATVQAGLDQIGAALEPAKQAALEPMLELQSGLETLREPLEAIVEATQMVAGLLGDATSQLHDAIGQCETLPEMLRAMIDQCVAVAGAGEGATFGDLHSAWRQLGPMIEEASAAASSRLAVGAAAEE